MEYGGETYDDYEEVKNDYESYDDYIEHYYGALIHSENNDEKYNEALNLLINASYKLEEITEQDFKELKEKELLLY